MRWIVAVALLFAPQAAHANETCWAAQPTPEQYAAAVRIGDLGPDFREAVVFVSCAVLPDGQLECRVLSETPPGQGFGDRALTLMQLYRLCPGEAELIQLQIRFRADDLTLAPSPSGAPWRALRLG